MKAPFDLETFYGQKHRKKSFSFKSWSLWYSGWPKVRPSQTTKNRNLNLVFSLTTMSYFGQQFCKARFTILKCPAVNIKIQRACAVYHSVHSVSVKRTKIVQILVNQPNLYSFLPTMGTILKFTHNVISSQF